MSLTAERLQEAMRRRGVDQSELARRIGATQGAISKILLGKTRNSRFLPRVATELAFPLAWLQGVTDDDGSSPSDGNELTLEEREWIDLLRDMEPKERSAILTLARSIATNARSPTVHSRGYQFRAG